MYNTEMIFIRTKREKDVDYKRQNAYLTMH